jgi:hypothetical protein
LRAFRKIKNKQILKVTALYVIWNPEICQDPTTCGQDDLVLYKSCLKSKKTDKTIEDFQDEKDIPLIKSRAFARNQKLI